MRTGDVTAALLALLLAADAPVTPEARDAALVRAFHYLDETLWSLNDGGSPWRQYSMAVAAHAYLLAGARGGKPLPSRRRQLARLHDELVRYVARVDEKCRDPGTKELPPMERLYTVQWTWVLGAAAPYFAESLARGKRAGECRRTLKRIVRILEATQQPDGGWGHDDARRRDTRAPGLSDYPASFVAASYCGLTGLALAHRALKTDSDALRAGRAFFATCQSEDGTYPYAPRRLPPGWKPGMGPVAVARTGGVAFALFCAGAARTDPTATRALRAIDGRPRFMAEAHGSATMSLQFGGLLSRARGDRAWQAFRAEYFPRILARQEKSGAFLCASLGVIGANDETRYEGVPPNGRVYVTAIHSLLLVLDRTPSRILPAVPPPPGPVSGR